MRRPTQVQSIEVAGGQLWGELREAATEYEATCLAEDSWQTDAELPTFGETVHQLRERRQHARLLYDGQNGVVRVYRGPGGLAVASAYARTMEDAEALLARVKNEMPVAEPDEEEVTVVFWSYGMRGPESRTRQLAAADWPTIERNYPQGTYEKLAKMMSSSFEPGKGGQLVLWSGPAGTGKTTALRALAQEWKDWCKLHYIVDAEKFFGANADYLMEVLVGGEGDVIEDEDEKPRPEMWRLLVLEDCGELLSKDAAAHVGKALARCLNTVDGMIGQGLRVMVLVTTNEPVGELHEAISRPGRAAVQIDFPKLNAAEARLWREAHGVEDTTQMPASLAELYAELAGTQQEPIGTRKQVVGFTG